MAGRPIFLMPVTKSSSVLTADEGSDGQVVVGEELFFAEAVLGDVEDMGTGAEGGELLADNGRFRRYILEFISHHVNPLRELPHRIQILIGSGKLLIGDLAGGRVTVR